MRDVLFSVSMLFIICLKFILILIFDLRHMCGCDLCDFVLISNVNEHLIIYL